ncbi:Proline-rich protein like [Quillaja saponaria]|uniref:Proline-rich protein like n=1 Tax=Quillaja saponaria TaxID=32244 RepID=A0AAD7M2A7_QUISA|nr:Proline-rich protein like [Quillaja saponaria]
MPIGWPLGLGSMNRRLREVENAETLPAAAVDPYSLYMPSNSFSSFSSSNLDTQSSASFFHDRSVSLGRLIGIKPGERGRLYFPNSIRFEERERILKDSCPDASKGQGIDLSRWICIPLLLGALVKMSQSKKSRR